MNIAEILENYAYSRPERVALKDVRDGIERTVTYRKLNCLSSFASDNLIKLGIKCGDKVLLAVPLSIETYVLLLALFRIGATAVIIDPSQGVSAMRSSLVLVKPDAMLSGIKAKLAGCFFPEIRNIHTKIDVKDVLHSITGHGLQYADSKAIPCTNLNASHPALVTFTSGSTGIPKAITRSHGFLLTQQNVLANTMPMKEDSVELTTLPVFVLSALAQGTTSILPDCDMRKPDAINGQNILRQIRRNKVVRIIASPAFLSRVTNCAYKTATCIPEVEQIYTGGGPVFPSLLNELELTFPNAQITAVYGSTEAEPIAHISKIDMTSEDITKSMTGAGLIAGKPIEEIDLAIIDASSLEKVKIDSIKKEISELSRLPPFYVGEILVSGEHVINSYLNGVGDSETKIFDGFKTWHRTGDAGYLDAEGRLWLMGRCSSKINDGSGELYPFQVEVAASEISSLRRATCVQLENKRILVIEKKHRTPLRFVKDLFLKNDSFIRTISNAFSWLRFDEVRFVYAMPVDARHNSKIQYAELERRLK